MSKKTILKPGTTAEIVSAPETSQQVSAAPVVTTQKLSRGLELMKAQVATHEEIIKSLSPEIPNPQTEAEFNALPESEQILYIQNVFNEGFRILTVSANNATALDKASNDTRESFQITQSEFAWIEWDDKNEKKIPGKTLLMMVLPKSSSEAQTQGAFMKSNMNNKRSAYVTKIKPAFITAQEAAMVLAYECQIYSAVLGPGGAALDPTDAKALRGYEGVLGQLYAFNVISKFTADEKCTALFEKFAVKSEQDLTEMLSNGEFIKEAMDLMDEMLGTKSQGETQKKCRLDTILTRLFLQQIWIDNPRSDKLTKARKLRAAHINIEDHFGEIFRLLVEKEKPKTSAKTLKPQEQNNEPGLPENLDKLEITTLQREAIIAYHNAFLRQTKINPAAFGKSKIEREMVAMLQNFREYYLKNNAWGVTTVSGIRLLGSYKNTFTTSFVETSSAPIIKSEVHQKKLTKKNSEIYLDKNSANQFSPIILTWSYGNSMMKLRFNKKHQNIEQERKNILLSYEDSLWSLSLLVNVSQGKFFTLLKNASSMSDEQLANLDVELYKICFDDSGKTEAELQHRYSMILSAKDRMMSTNIQDFESKLKKMYEAGYSFSISLAAFQEKLAKSNQKP